MNEIKKIAILTSGMSRGSNFLAIHNWLVRWGFPIQIGFVTVSRTTAPIIERCRSLGVTYYQLPTRDMEIFECRLLELLEEHDIKLIALAGFLKKLSPDFIRRCGIPILNIHPALLPRYGGQGMYGSRVHQAVFEAKEKESGVTVHLVNEDYDTGPVVMQKRIKIDDCCSPDEIADRVLLLEHRVYVRAICAVLQVKIAEDETEDNCRG